MSHGYSHDGGGGLMAIEINQKLIQKGVPFQNHWCRLPPGVEQAQPAFFKVKKNANWACTVKNLLYTAAPA
jgi:hypothetical protein